jgi:hypothetical protein
MAKQTREQGRYLGGRPPYGYRLAEAGPHPNKAHVAWGRRVHKLEPDPVTAPVVSWMFSQRLAERSAARITRALNDAGVPCPSAADPGAADGGRADLREFDVDTAGDSTASAAARGPDRHADVERNRTLNL